jgi:DNA-binding PadR family transcriptional regulator
MPRTKTFLTPAEYAVLGLVRERPAYGYELQRHLTGKRGLGRVCPVEPAMVYAILKSLSGLELINGEWDSSTYPPKAIYRITDNGYAAFERWLRSPVGRMREVRLDFLIKLYFALKDDLELARELLATQIEVTSDYAEEIAGERAHLGEGPQSFDAIVLESKASAAHITREWLEKCLEALSPSYASKRKLESGEHT